ncbi:MAG: DUF917 domain-containing protein [Chloroflexi bacterium]|nr:MAG: DUF917 domain-containing protein [Chloroflexota bacterium]
MVCRSSGWTYRKSKMRPGRLRPSASARSRRAPMGLQDRLGRRAMMRAIDELQKYTGKKIEAIVPVELGGGNMPAPIVNARRLGIPAVDGDYSGRAVPEVEQGTPHLFDKDSRPAVTVDRWGNVTIIKETQNDAIAERMGKMLSVAAFGGCSMASTLLRGKEMKEVLVRDTLTRCYELGQAVRTAREQGRDPVQAAIAYLQGWLLFRGEVTSKEWEDRGGYMYGTTTMAGRDEFAGQTMKVWFKNENHIAWLDDQPFVTSPDPICLLNPQTGEGYSNTTLKAGDRVSVIGAKGVEAFRSERGLAAAGPAHFGFDMRYVPIEQAVQRLQQHSRSV